MTTAYPLQWPTGRPRTDRYRREHGKFDVTFARARDNIVAEVRLLCGGRYAADPNIVISTDIALRRDGLPLANQRAPEDPGVAVYFTYKKRQMSFACDRWLKIEHNMQAIAKTIEALRGIARWGTGDMLEAAFTGFTALPAPGVPRHWREIIGVEPHVRDLATVRAEYRRRAAQHHPDRAGGSHEAMTELNAALAAAEKELG
ncbi:MAG TPA: J domain-containing protein [Paraburkholderia sp.]